MTEPLVTPDGRYVIVRGRLWRRSDPRLTEAQRQALVDQLMEARRAVGRALRSDAAALPAARAAVDATKTALGERGPVWWSDATDGGAVAGIDDVHSIAARGRPFTIDKARRAEETAVSDVERQFDRLAGRPARIGESSNAPFSPHRWPATETIVIENLVKRRASDGDSVATSKLLLKCHFPISSK